MQYGKQYEFKLCSLLKLSSNGKAMILASVEYSPNGKDIIVPMEHTPVVYSPNGKGMIL